MFSDAELRTIADSGRNGEKMSTDELQCALAAEMILLMRRQTPLRKQFEPIPPASVPLKK